MILWFHKNGLVCIVNTQGLLAHVKTGMCLRGNGSKDLVENVVDSFQFKQTNDDTKDVT